MTEYKKTDNPCKSRLCKTWHSVWNPLGNVNVPKPFPAKRAKQAKESLLPDDLWWALRNPFHNFNHYWIGITPLGEDGEWRTPEEDGWTRVKISDTKYVWKKPGHIDRPIKYGELFGYEWYAGWMKRGNFGLAFRRK